MFTRCDFSVISTTYDYLSNTIVRKELQSYRNRTKTRLLRDRREIKWLSQIKRCKHLNNLNSHRNHKSRLSNPLHKYRKGIRRGRGIQARYLRECSIGTEQCAVRRSQTTHRQVRSYARRAVWSRDARRALAHGWATLSGHGLLNGKFK